MAAYYFPTLCTAAKPYFGASRRSGGRNEIAACRCGGASRRIIEAAAGDCTKHSAWTSIRQERWEGDLAVEGRIPAWLNGTYLRNGPGIWEVGDHAFHHVFDGYGTLVRVSFQGSRGHATGAHRQIESDAYKAAMAQGRPDPVMREWSQLCPSEPGMSLVDRLRRVVELATGAGTSDNANTAVLPLGDGRVVCLADVTKSSVLVDPQTLATVGKLRFTDSLWCPVQCVHPVVTTTTAGGEVLTLLPDFTRRGYMLARMSAGSNRREVIGKVRCRGGTGTTGPAWVHSFAITDKYVVMPEMPIRYSVAHLLSAERTPLYVMDWLPDSGSYIHVICRSTGNTVASVEVPPFVAFHFINAYEEKGNDDGARPSAIVADCCEYYGDPAIIHALDLHRLRSPEAAKDFPESRVARFRIPLDGSAMGELETVLDPNEHGRGVELSTINPAYVGKEYRYLYACTARRPCNFFNALSKMDLVEKEAKSWHEEGTVPSEPFFVARPGATNEDDGVVISTVSTMDGEGYVLLLDAATFEEIARLQLPYGIPFGFHGCWIPDNKY